MPRYRILPGASFKLADGTTAGAGAEIDLDADIAAMHAAALQPLPDDQPTPDALATEANPE